MNISPTNPKEYIQAQLDDMGFSELMRLAKFLDESEMHLADLESHYNKLESANNDCSMMCIDADKRADTYRDTLDEIHSLSGRIYG